MKITKEIAECVGLWLAEGNNKCNNEITFTNNSFELISLFDKVISSMFDAPNKRIYVYSAKGQEITKAISSFSIIKYYSDERARKPYFIWRLASVKLMKAWKDIVAETLSQSKFYADILRGFFAGEGNVKTGSHANRTLRIAQKYEKEWISNILNALGISYYFEPGHRQYVVVGKWNWDIFAQHTLADLHPLKKERFWSVYNSFKQAHYSKRFMHKQIMSDLRTPRTASWLSVKYNRTHARVFDVLSDLKYEGKIDHKRVGHTNYWYQLAIDKS
jgi:hypothetical protein